MARPCGTAEHRVPEQRTSPGLTEKGMKSNEKVPKLGHPRELGHRHADEASSEAP